MTSSHERVIVPVPQRRHRIGYWTTAATYLALQAFTTVPSPLYATYAERDDLTSLVITIVYAAYAVGVVASLVLAGHLSDVFGRRPVLASALAVDATSAAVFVAWPGVTGLFAARVLCGLAVGITASTATAYLAELFAAHRPSGRAHELQLLATAVSIGGLGAGPLVAGVTAEVVGSPLVTPYVVMLVVFAACAAALLVAPETRERVVPLPPYRPQRVSVPHHARRRYAAALTGVATVFALFGLLVGLAGTILGQALHHVSIALTGELLFVVFATGVLSVVFTVRLAHRTLVGVAGTSMLSGLALLVLTVWIPAVGPTTFVVMFLLAGAVIGAGGSTMFTVSLAVASDLAPHDRVAETLAGFFLAGYVALSVPVIGVGLALQWLSTRTTLLGFAALVGAAVIGALPGLLRAGAEPAETLAAHQSVSSAHFRD